MNNNLWPLTSLECRYRAEELIKNLHESNNGEEVLIQLNNFIMQQAISEVMCMDLGFQLWNSPVTVTILLQEVVAVYPNFLNSTLTMKESARISNALIVFLCMAYHPKARMGLLKANIPYYLYPFFQISTNVMKPLQFSILSLIAALAEVLLLRLIQNNHESFN
nr:CCR4-NOT transcription complex subunit 9-like [Solanum lycopersicum]